jgi:putative redox protein
MYAKRKGWELGDVEAEVQMEYDERGGPSEFNVTLRIGTHLEEEQLDRLRVIAGKCPVHRALAGETRVTITDRVECD